MTTGSADSGKPQGSPGRDANSPHPSQQAPGSQEHGRGLPIKLRFLKELQRRNVVRVAVLYLVVSWLILEPVHVIFHMLEVPAWANRLVLILMALGFPAVVIFAWAFEITPEGLKPTHEVEPHQSITKATAQRLNRAIIAVLVLALSYFVVDKFWLSKHATTESRVSAQEKIGETAHAADAAASTAARPAISERSIAVLAFIDMSEKKDQEYFSDGLSEELIDLLAKTQGLQVTARTSSFYFKGKSEDVPTIAQRLHVAHVLEGSVRKAGNTMRVTAQLIRAATGVHLWSETYDRDLKDVFKVQDEIAGAVVTALKVHLLPSQQGANAHRTANVEAYNQYLRGKNFFNRSTRDGFRLAVEAYHKAVELDPNYAAAYAGLAMAEAYAADETNDAAGFQRAVADAERAVALAPGLADGYVARATVMRMHLWDWSGAQADLEKALALDGGDATVQRRYADMLETLGRLPEAIEAAKKATEADPLSEAQWTHVGLYLYESGQIPAARQALTRALEINPESIFGRWNLGVVELLDRQSQKALNVFRQVKDPQLCLNGVALAEHTLSHAKESQAALDELIKTFSLAAAYQIAEVYAWRGEKDKGFEWLERAYVQRDPGLDGVKGDPLLASLHGDSRFKAFLRKMKLPE